MAKAKTATKIKGANAADKAAIKAARATPREAPVRTVANGDQTPEAQRTTSAKQTAAAAQFHDADKNGAPTLESAAARRAALGY